jgi:hypothetical protein
MCAHLYAVLYRARNAIIPRAAFASPLILKRAKQTVCIVKKTVMRQVELRNKRRRPTRSTTVDATRAQKRLQMLKTPLISSYRCAQIELES